MKIEGKPVPSDWDGESYSFYMLCGPDSVLWHGYIKGAIYELTRGRGWDINTGNIKATQEIAWGIYNSMAKCNDFIKVQRMLVAAIIGEAVDLTDEQNLIPDAVDFTQTGLAPQLRTVDADKRLADVVEDLQLSPVTNVTNQIDTQAVADNIEAFRATYETQTTTETAAANTRINDLIAAVQALNLACETVINNTIECGGGCCEGTDPPPPPATEGDPPPEGWQPPIDPDTGEETTPGQPAYQNRKCKAANMLHDGIREAIYRMNIAGVEDLLVTFSTIVGGSLGVILGPIIASIIGAALGPFVLVGGILGVVSGAIVALALGSPNLSTLVTLLDDNQTDLVCALYNSTSADQAINDYIQILTDQGANTTQQELLWAIFNTVAANALFFRLDTADGDAVEAALDGYMGGVDCSMCSTWEWEYEWGSGPDPIPVDGSVFTVTSEVDPQSGNSEISLQIPTLGCAALHTVEFVSVVSGNPNNGFGVYNWASCAYNRIVTEQTPSAGSWPACRITVTESSGSQFSVQLRITEI